MINDFLDYVLEDFADYVESQEDLCKLRDTHFDAGRIPDYTDINIQQLYLLRYAYAYAFEYKYMYKHLLRRFPRFRSIEVSSIGCGSMIDYWALSRVIEKPCSIRYRGVDTIKWFYQFPIRTNDSVEFYHENALDFFNQEILSSDIYIFPKSISEFSQNEVEQIASHFTADSIIKDQVHFMFSLRIDEGSMARDAQKTDVIYRNMLDIGFHTEDPSNRYYHFGDEVNGKNIHHVDTDFKLPNATIDFLKELYTNCPHFEQCVNQNGCRSRLGRYPILKCRYAAWQVFSFERE